MDMSSKSAPTIAAIPTTYNGVTFRSRTEARWAVFFDQLDIPWDYEPEGYQLKAGWYAPDFWLPSHEMFFEVKPGESKYGLDKCNELIAMTGKPVCMSLGQPAFPQAGDDAQSLLPDSRVGFPVMEGEFLVTHWRPVVWGSADHPDWPLAHRIWPYPMTTQGSLLIDEEAFAKISGGCFPVGPKSFEAVWAAIEVSRGYRFWDPAR